MVVRDEYKDRFAQAMKLAGKDVHAIAADLGVTYQAVSKVLSGATKALRADNNAIAARAMGVRSPCCWACSGPWPGPRSGEATRAPKPTPPRTSPPFAGFFCAIAEL